MHTKKLIPHETPSYVNIVLDHGDQLHNPVKHTVQLSWNTCPLWYLILSFPSGTSVDTHVSWLSPDACKEDKANLSMMNDEESDKNMIYKTSQLIYEHILIPDRKVRYQYLVP